MFSFKLATCTMFGAIKVVVRVEETIWSPGTRPRLEIGGLSGLNLMHTDFDDMGHLLKTGSSKMVFKYVSVLGLKTSRRQKDAQQLL